MNYLRDPNRLDVYTEIRRSKLFVGTLTYDPKTQEFQFDYDRKYLVSKSAIPLGPELSLKKKHYVSRNGLFPSLADRIPSRENPAYEEYCISQGISPSEKNPIVLLTTIGRRGPSTFVFEPVYLTSDDSREVRFFREKLGLTLREMAAAFDLNLPTISKIEMGKSKDKNTIKLLSIYMNFPEVALWQVRLNESRLHHDTSEKLITFFANAIRRGERQLG
jgi:HipA-like protein